MAVLLSIPILSLVAIFQTAVISRIPLFEGTADLLLVVIIAYALQKTTTAAWQWAVVAGFLADFFSGLPFGVFTISYLITMGAVLILRNRIWRFSFLIQLLLTLFGTLISHLITMLVLYIQNTNIPLLTAFQQVTLPSLVLNFMLALPVFLIVQDLIQQITITEDYA